MSTEFTSETASAPGSVFPKIPSPPTEPSTSNATKLLFKKPANTKFPYTCSLEDRPVGTSLTRPPLTTINSLSLLFCPSLMIPLTLAPSMDRNLQSRGLDFPWTKPTSLFQLMVSTAQSLNRHSLKSSANWCPKQPSQQNW